MKHIVVFSGSGVSAESGIKTFRDSGGLWEEYSIEEVATPQAWAADMKKVNEFYNQRRKQVIQALPNAAHNALAKLESKFKVSIITQNIDDLHERAGSKNVLHLHGEIMKCRSSIDENIIYEMKNERIEPGDLCELGSQLRPHIVWFGELVPAMEIAAEIISTADVFIVTGTSLQVYPAASLAHACPQGIPYYLVDPHANELSLPSFVESINENAGTGIPILVDQLLDFRKDDQ